MIEVIQLSTLSTTQIEDIITDSLNRIDVEKITEISNVNFIKLYYLIDEYILYSDTHKIVGIPIPNFKVTTQTGAFNTIIFKSNRYYHQTRNDEYEHNTLFIRECDFIVILMFFDRIFRQQEGYKFNKNMLCIDDIIKKVFDINYSFSLLYRNKTYKYFSSEFSDIFLNEYYGEYVDIYKNRLSDSFDFSVVWMYTWFRLENIKLKLDEHPGLQYRERDNNWFTNNKGMLNFYKMYKNGQYKIDENII
jgi:hypothetical protein